MASRWYTRGKRGVTAANSLSLGTQRRLKRNKKAVVETALNEKRDPKYWSSVGV